MSVLKPSLLFLTVTVTATAAIGAEPAKPFPLKSVSVDLPTSDRSFPAGPGVEIVANNCVACHSAGMILTQPALAKTAWEAEVKKMIGVYKASVSKEDAVIIVDYLAMNLRK